MKRRFVLWGLALSLTAVATAVSFHIPVPRTYTKSDQARDLGVTVQQMERVRKMGYQLSSDLRYGRPVREKDVQYLLDLASGGSKLGIDVMWQFACLKGTKYEARAVKIAYKWSSSTDENVAFVAIDNLKYFGDPRWKSLAENYPWSIQEYCKALLDPQS